MHHYISPHHFLYLRQNQNPELGHVDARNKAASLFPVLPEPRVWWRWDHAGSSYVVEGLTGICIDNYRLHAHMYQWDWNTTSIILIAISQDNFFGYVKQKCQPQIIHILPVYTRIPKFFFWQCSFTPFSLVFPSIDGKAHRTGEAQVTLNVYSW